MISWWYDNVGQDRHLATKEIIYSILWSSNILDCEENNISRRYIVDSKHKFYTFTKKSWNDKNPAFIFNISIYYSQRRMKRIDLLKGNILLDNYRSPRLPSLLSSLVCIWSRSIECQYCWLVTMYQAINKLYAPFQINNPILTRLRLSIKGKSVSERLTKYYWVLNL